MPGAGGAAPGPATADPARRGIVLVVLAMGFFSLSDVFAKRLVTDALPVLEIVWFRYLALAASVAWLLARGAPLQRPARPLLQAGRGACVVASAVLFNIGLARLPLAAATALVFSSPLFVTALSVLVLRERVRVRQWGWVLLGFCGVLLVARPGTAAFDPAALLPIASSLAWAAAMILTRLVAGGDSPFTTQVWTGAVGLLVLTAGLGLDFIVPTAAQGVELAAMAAAWCAAQWLVVHAYAGSHASRVAPYSYSQLVWANLLSIALLQQLPSTATVLGSLVIVVAGIGAVRWNAR